MGSTDQVKSGWRAFDIAADDGETISDRRSRRRAAAERALGKKKGDQQTLITPVTNYTQLTKRPSAGKVPERFFFSFFPREEDPVRCQRRA